MACTAPALEPGQRKPRRSDTPPPLPPTPTHTTTHTPGQHNAASAPLTHTPALHCTASMARPGHLRRRLQAPYTRTQLPSSLKTAPRQHTLPRTQSPTCAALRWDASMALAKTCVHVRALASSDAL